ncbi:MAG TPA: glycosyltransferase family 39 protein [Acidimicrobiales bacterium]|nr:glycosyltransferase family 39 protein [Acidimicrobiales bacterium]
MVAAALLLWAAGSISWTWDEQVDMAIVDCLVASRNPFACTSDIEQTRLPFYVHAAAATLAPWEGVHYAISAVFGLVNVVLVFVLARSRFGLQTALVAMALVATTPTLLASGRMLLSHSNVMLTTFTLVAVVAYDRFDRNADRRFFWLSAAALGLAVASSVLGLLTALVIAGYWLAAGQRRELREPVVYAAVAGAAFLLSTLVYLQPRNLATFVNALLHTYRFPEWNYMGLATNEAPRWFSPLLFVIKIGPWWAALFAVAPLVLRRSAVGEGGRRCALAIWGGFLAYLVLKSGVLRYDAPHQQAAWYPLVLVVVAATVTELVRRAGAARSLVLTAMTLFAALHLYDTHRFFPNYLFHGVQYGSSLIGEFYGPAVFHAQDRTDIDDRLDAIVAADPTVRILMADNNAFQRGGENFVPFTRRDPEATYSFAVLDRLYASHFGFPERDEYNAFLAREYRVVHSHNFPGDEWAYRILRSAS